MLRVLASYYTHLQPLQSISLLLHLLTNHLNPFIPSFDSSSFTPLHLSSSLLFPLIFSSSCLFSLPSPPLSSSLILSYFLFFSLLSSLLSPLLLHSSSVRRRTLHLSQPDLSELETSTMSFYLPHPPTVSQVMTARTTSTLRVQFLLFLSLLYYSCISLICMDNDLSASNTVLIMY